MAPGVNPYLEFQINCLSMFVARQMISEHFVATHTNQANVAIQVHARLNEPGTDSTRRNMDSVDFGPPRVSIKLVKNFRIENDLCINAQLT